MKRCLPFLVCCSCTALWGFLWCAPGQGFQPPTPTIQRHSEAVLFLSPDQDDTVVVDKEPAALHTIQGIQCLQVKVSLPVVGDITILEATADAQEVLVNLALEDDAQDNNNNNPASPTTNLAHADPYGAVLWPAATAVARTLLTTHKDWLHDKDAVICELGTGTGLVSLAALLAGAASTRVVATDYEVLPLKLLEYAAQHLNHHQSSTTTDNHHDRLSTQLLDLCRYDKNPDNNNNNNKEEAEDYMPLPADATVVVAADVMYEPTTGRALAHRVVEALRNGARVLIGDSPGRAGRPAFLAELQRLGIRGNPRFVESPGWTVMGHRHELICGKTSKTVSQDRPQQLMVALMELDPKIHCPLSAVKEI